MRKISTARSSRRAPPLKDTDYDHEINLVDHITELDAPSPEPLIPQTTSAPEENNLSARQTTATDHTTLSKYTNAASSPDVPEAGPSRARSSSRSTVTAKRSSSRGSISTTKSKGSRKSKFLRKSRKSLKSKDSQQQAIVPSVEVERENLLPIMPRD